MNMIPAEFEPTAQYDRYCREQDVKFEYLQRHTKCRECNECTMPTVFDLGYYGKLPDDYDEEVLDILTSKIGWCRVHDEFIIPDEYAIYYDCEDVNVD